MQFINRKNGEILTKEKEFMERWRKYYKDLLNYPRELEEHIEDNDGIETDINKTVDNEELEKLIKELKNAETPGSDKVTAEMINKHGTERKGHIVTNLQLSMGREDLAKGLEESTNSTHFQKKRPQGLQQLRRNHTTKYSHEILEKIIAKRIRMEETKSRFRNCGSTQDHVFTIKQIKMKGKFLCHFWT